MAKSGKAYIAFRGVMSHREWLGKAFGGVVSHREWLSRVKRLVVL